MAIHMLDAFDAVVCGLATAIEVAKERPRGDITPWQRLLLAGEFHDGGRVMQPILQHLLVHDAWYQKIAAYGLCSGRTLDRTIGPRQIASTYEDHKSHRLALLGPDKPDAPETGVFCLRFPLTHKAMAASLPPFTHVYKSRQHNDSDDSDDEKKDQSSDSGSETDDGDEDSDGDEFQKVKASEEYANVRRALSGPDWDAWLHLRNMGGMSVTMMAMDTKEGFDAMFDFMRVDQLDLSIVRDCILAYFGRYPGEVKTGSFRDFVFQSPRFSDRCDDLLTRFERIDDWHVTNDNKTLCGFCRRPVVYHGQTIPKNQCHAYQQNLFMTEYELDLMHAVLFPRVDQMQRYVNVMGKLYSNTWDAFKRGWDYGVKYGFGSKTHKSVVWFVQHRELAKRLYLLAQCIPLEYRTTYREKLFAELDVLSCSLSGVKQIKCELDTFDWSLLANSNGTGEKK